MWEVASVLLGGKFTLFIIFTSKKEKFKISDLNSYVKKLERSKQTQCKKKVVKIKGGNKKGKHQNQWNRK